MKKIVKVLLIIIFLAIPFGFFLRFNSEKAHERVFDQQRIKDLENFKKGAENYFKDNGCYPVLDEGGCLEDYKETFRQRLVPQYLDSIPAEPEPGFSCYFYQTQNQGELYKLSARLSFEKEKAKTDGGNLDRYFEIFNQKEEKQVVTYLDHQVMSWGNNEANQLGIENGKYKKGAQLIEGLTNVVAIAAGSSVSLALTSQGDVYTWGNKEFKPVKVKNLKNIKAIAAGANHFLALNSEGKVFDWGKNDFGQLGDSTKTERDEPQEVKNLPQIKAISAGANHSLALTSDGFIYAWGDNSQGQIGDGVSSPDRIAPVRVEDLREVEKITAGLGHSLALTSDGQVYAWGYNYFGELGLGNNQDQNRPQEVKSLKGIKEIAAGDYHSLALGENGMVYAWGYNKYGELGDSSGEDKNRPVIIKDFFSIEKLAAGSHHSLALTSSREVYSWGYNFFGQIGDLTTHDRFSPVKVLKNKFLNFLIKEPLDNIVAISAGDDFSLAIRKGE